MYIYPRCKSLGLIEALHMSSQYDCEVAIYPRCKSLGLIEASLIYPRNKPQRLISEV